MDLVASAKNIIVAMQQVSKSGDSKLLRNCTLPLTGIRCIHKVVTEMAVFEIDIENGGFQLIERAPGVSVNEIRNATAGRFSAADNVPEMQLGG